MRVCGVAGAMIPLFTRHRLFAVRRMRGHSSFGRAPPCQGGGSEFESRCPLQRRSTPLPLRFRRCAAKTAPDGYASPFRAKLQVSLGKTEERLIVPFPRGSRRLLAETSANELVPPFRPKLQVLAGITGDFPAKLQVSLGKTADFPRQARFIPGKWKAVSGRGRPLYGKF